MSSAEKDLYFDCSLVSIHYIICECGKTFPSENELKLHLVKEHPHKRERKEFKCGVCGSTFNSEESCITHYEDTHIINEEIKEEHLEDDLEDTKPDIKSDTNHGLVKLEVEPKVDDEYMYNVEVTNTDEVVEEQVIDEEVVDEEVISEEVVNEEEVMDHEEIDEEGNQVLHIPEEYGQVVQNPDGQLVLIVNNKETRNITEMITKYTDASSDQPQNCFTAVNEYLRKANIKPRLPIRKGLKLGNIRDRGVQNVSVEVKKPLHRKKKKSIKNRTCEVCGNSYASNAALKYHQRTHTGERPYSCHFCNKTFTMALFLQVHIRSHTGERPYVCPDCPKAFTNQAALHRHHRVHTGEKPYPCPMCGKTFSQSNSMKLHVTTVHLKQPTPYKSRKRKLKAEENRRKKSEGYVNEPKPKVRKQKVYKTESESGEEEQVYEMMESENEPKAKVRKQNAPKSESESGEDEQVYEMIESEEINEQGNGEYIVLYE